MPFPIQIGIALLLAIQTVPCAIVAGIGPRENKSLRFDIDLMDGGLLGFCRWKRVDAANRSAPPSGPAKRAPNFYYVHYVWDGTHLRVHPGEEDKREWRKEAIAKDGWYVTADYATKPPRVIVTKEPTKYSRWRFIRTEGYQRYYIKNENDLGKDAWLRLEATDQRFARSDAREARVYKAVLSFDKKEKFFVNDIEADDGK
jgi:hypothetical protein